MVRGIPKVDDAMFGRLGIKGNMQALFIEQTEPVQWVLAENWLSFNVFLDLQTQWRVGINGPTGLDYQAVKTVFELNCIPKKRWTNLFRDIRTMEAAWLEERNKLKQEQGER